MLWDYAEECIFQNTIVFYQANNQANTKAAISTKNLLPQIASDEEMLYYTVIADVSKSQIVYREYRKVGADASEANLNSIIYDSFKIIANWNKRSTYI